MPVINSSQIPDGFATVRTRGLQRKRSNHEKYSFLRPASSVTKCDSIPLFDNNNDVGYGNIKPKIKPIGTPLIRYDQHHQDQDYNHHSQSYMNERIDKSVDDRIDKILSHTTNGSLPDCSSLKNSSNDSGFMTHTSSIGKNSLDSDRMKYENLKDFGQLCSPALAAKLNDVNYLNTQQQQHRQKRISSDRSTVSFEMEQIDSIVPSPEPMTPLNQIPTNPIYMNLSNGYKYPSPYPTNIPNVKHQSSVVGQQFQFHDDSSSFYLYQRPESPQYMNVMGSPSSKPNNVKHTYENVMQVRQHHFGNKKESLSTYQNNSMQQLYTKKSLPKKSNTLQYRKSYSYSSRPKFDEDNEAAESKLATNYYNPKTNYFSPNEIHGNHKLPDSGGLARIKSSSVRASNNDLPSRVNGVERRFATLGYPKEKKEKPITGYNLSSSGGDLSKFDYCDPLDCKIGCQTMLRSKPRIPWYELAIRNNETKRQSCPAFEAQVVAAFEQSLTNMTQRLQQLTSTAERKDSELHEMRQTIELLRKQSIQAGLTTAHMQSMGTMQSNNQNQSINKPTANGIVTTDGTNGNGPQISPMQRHHSTDSMCSLNSLSSGCSTQDKKKKKGWLRSSFTKAFSRNAKITKTNRHHLQSSNNLDQSHPPLPPTLNNSSGYQSTLVADSALPPPSPSKSPQKMMTVIENAKPIDDIENNPIVEDLKKQLREKDLVLTDIRLEALSSASQLENLKDTVMKMTTEMMILKQNNERLEKLVTSRSLAGSDVSLGIPGSPVNSLSEARRYSLIDGMPRPPMDLPKSLDETEEENIPPAPAPEPPPPLSPMSSRIDLTPPPPPPLDNGGTNGDVMTNAGEDAADHTDGKKIAIAVYLGQPESFAKYSEDLNETDYYYASPNRDIQENGQDKHKSYSLANGFNETVIAYTYISNKTTWQNLDYIVRKTFKDYLAKIDPNTNLGLNTDSITSYHLGDAKRGPEIGFPELLPCGYIVGNVRTLYVCLQGVGSLAFDSLIPRSIVHRYISLLTEHRRLILCGPSGTGKSYLARKLAEFLVARTGRDNPSEAIATFNVDHKTTKEFRQYLNHIAEQASIATNGAAELPAVIILDNLHHAAATGDIFQCLLSAGSAGNLPCIIGTMSQATCSTTNLQIHHNFRWVLTANHMEPVKGFLGRFLRRRLQSIELSSHSQQPELAAVFAWLPTVWQHINRFLETHSSSDVTIGPRLFLQCPLNLKDSQAWFTDVWNYHLAPYLVDAVREGVQLYGRRGGVWVDPCTFIRDTYPWPHAPGQIPPLRQINAEDVGLEGTDNCGDSQDPLMNMLKHLLEVADTSHNQQEQESDCASQCSNMTQDSSMGVEINE